MGLTEGLIAGASLGEARQRRKSYEREAESDRAERKSGQQLRSFEMLSSLMQQDAAIGSDISNLLPQRNAAADMAMRSLMALDLVRGTNDRAAISDAEASHLRNVALVDELDGHMRGLADRQNALRNSTGVISDFLAKQGFLLDSEALRQERQQMMAPTMPMPFTLQDMGGQPQGAAPAEEAPQDPAGANAVGAPEAEEASAAAPMSNPQDTVLQMWSEAGRQAGLPGLGDPNVSMRNGSIVLTTTDEAEAKGWQERIKRLGEGFNGAVPPIIVNNRMPLLEKASAEYLKFSDRAVRQQSQLSSLELLKKTPSDLAGIERLVQMARAAERHEEADRWEMILNSPSEKVRIERINAAIEEIRPELKRFSDLRDSLSAPQQEYLQLIGAGPVVPAPSGAAGTPRLSQQEFYAQQIEARGRPKTPAEAKAIQDAWLKYSSGG